MKTKADLSILRYVMLLLNITECLFIALTIFLTSHAALLARKADVFVSSLSRVVENPRVLLFFFSFVCFLSFASFTIRQAATHARRTATALTIVADTFFGTLLLFSLDFNCNGFILYLLSNIIYYIKSSRKYVVIALGSLLYMFFSHDVLSVYFPLFSVKEYFLFFDRTIQHRMFLVFYVLKYLNFVCFIIFSSEISRRQKSTIDEIRRLYAKLREANTALKEYADIKERMGETRERNRLAMEIHDTIGHALTGISVGVDTCIAIMDINPAVAKKQLCVISKTAKEGIADVRRSVRALHGEDASTSLSAEIREMLDKTRSTAGVAIKYIADLPLDFEGDERKTVFRVIQESVTNAIRHGKASEITIRISSEEKERGKALVIIIQDNGMGAKDFQCGFGTTHIRERLAMLGGTADFYSSEGEGFTVRAIMPIREDRTKKDEEQKL